MRGIVGYEVGTGKKKKKDVTLETTLTKDSVLTRRSYRLLIIQEGDKEEIDFG